MPDYQDLRPDIYLEYINTVKRYLFPSDSMQSELFWNDTIGQLLLKTHPTLYFTSRSQAGDSPLAGEMYHSWGTVDKAQ